MSADPVRIGQLTIRYLHDGAATRSVGMFELTVPPNANVPPPHSHPGSEELVHVLAGTLRYSVGSITRDLGAGGVMHTPPGEVHRFSNPFDAEARALVVLSPDIGRQYFVDIAALAAAGGPPDPAAMRAVMVKHGLRPAAPPA